MPTQAPVYYAPEALGPYPVGNVSGFVIDETRAELSTDAPNDRRTLPIEVWYPAQEQTRSLPRGTFAEFIGERAVELLPAVAPFLGLDPDALDGLLEDPTGSVPNAPIDHGGPFPLIVFSHASIGVRFQSFFLTEWLASHGYIVISADHTGSSIVSLLPDGTLMTTMELLKVAVPDAVVASEEYRTDPNLAFSDRVADVRFLVDVMSKWNSDDPSGRFTGKVDLDAVGVTGHNLGGFAAVEALAIDERFKAGAPVAGFVAPTVMDRPVMHVLGTEDGSIPSSTIEASFAAATGPKMLVRVVDAGHFSFSNLCLLFPALGDGCGDGTRENGETFTYLPDTEVHAATRFFLTALFGRYVKNDERYGADLMQNPFGESVQIEQHSMP